MNIYYSVSSTLILGDVKMLRSSVNHSETIFTVAHLLQCCVCRL